MAATASKPPIAGFKDADELLRKSWRYADRFVVRTVGGRCVVAPDVEAFLAASGKGDLWLGEPDRDPRLVAIASTGRQTLYRRAN